MAPTDPIVLISIEGLGLSVRICLPTAQVGRAWTVFGAANEEPLYLCFMGRSVPRGSGTFTGLDGFFMAYRGIGVPVGQASAECQPLGFSAL